MILTRVAFFAGGSIWAVVGLEESMTPTVAAIISFTSSLLIPLPSSSSLSLSSISSAFRPLGNRRIGPRLNTADDVRARRKRLRSRDEKLITLSRCRATGHACTRKGIDVRVGADGGVRWVET